MVPHVGTAESRVWREVKALGAGFGEDGAGGGGGRAGARGNNGGLERVVVRGTGFAAGSRDLRGDVGGVSPVFFERSIAVDFVHPGADLGGDDLVLAPALYLLTQRDAENLERFVARGGVFLTTYFSGVVAEDDRVVLGGYPGYLKKVLGLGVEEWSPMGEGETGRVRFGKGKRTVACSH